MGIWKRSLWFLAGCAAIAAGALMTDTLPSRTPAVWWIHPRSGAPGTLVHIVGSGLGEATLVTFGGQRAEFTLAGPRVIKAKVPAGAATGPITVTTPQGTVASPLAFPVQM
jgi:hypothetical protein